MATDYITIEGVANWVRVNVKNMDTKFGEKFTLELDVDPPTKAILEKTGWRGKIKTRDDGTEYAKFSRDNKAVFNNQETVLGPPEVVTSDGKPFNDFIGNGSELALTLEVYDTKKYGRGSRLKKVEILNLVPYERKEVVENNPPVD